MIAWVNFFTALFLNSVLGLQITLNLRRFLCCRQLVASIMNSSLFYYIVFWIRVCRFQYAHCVFIFVEVQHTSIIIGVVLKQMSSTAVQVCPWFVQRFKCTGKLKETAKKKTNQKQTVCCNFRFHSGLFWSRNCALQTAAQNIMARQKRHMKPLIFGAVPLSTLRFKKESASVTLYLFCRESSLPNSRALYKNTIRQEYRGFLPEKT